MSPLALFLLVVVGLPGPPAPPRDPAARQTVSGALGRDRRRLDLFWREIDRQRQNVGAPGRVNATLDEQRQGELPLLQPGPLTSW